MHLLITGGTGFIGSRLTRGALDRDWQVTLLTRHPESAAAQSLAGLGAALIAGDVTDRSAIVSALQQTLPDVFLHNAGWYELGIARRARAAMWATNVDGTQNALASAAEVGIPRVVYTSTTTAFGDTRGRLVDETFVRQADPSSHYERTKTEAHQIAVRHQQAGEPVVIVCPAQVIGPGDHSSFGRMARLYARRLLPPIAWAPQAGFTFAHVEDVADAMLRAVEVGRPGETYFVAGEVMTLREMTTAWSAASGRAGAFVWLPRPLALAQAALLAPLLRLAGQPAFLSPEVVRSTYVSYRYRSDKAIRDLGATFRPARLSWRQALEESVSPARVR